jgi:hypothetical protein
MNINDKINIKGSIEFWQKYTIKDWKKNIQKMRIGHSGALVNSFLSNLVMKSGGNEYKINFSFLYYGKFVDMGVGKGVPMGRKDTKRKPKKWYARALTYNINKLTLILRKNYGEQFADNVVQAIEIK